MKTRLTLFKLSRIVLAVCALCTMLLIMHGYANADMPNSVAEHSDVMWRAVVALLGLLQTILMGIAVWMISNIRELFIRTGRLEGNCQTMEAVCDERHGRNR